MQTQNSVLTPMKFMINAIYMTDVLKVTRIAVAHRLSTIESADKILIMKEGQIVETGTYKELKMNPDGYLNRPS